MHCSLRTHSVKTKRTHLSRFLKILSFSIILTKPPNPTAAATSIFTFATHLQHSVKLSLTIHSHKTLSVSHQSSSPVSTAATHHRKPLYHKLWSLPTNRTTAVTLTNPQILSLIHSRSQAPRETLLSKIQTPWTLKPSLPPITLFLCRDLLSNNTAAGITTTQSMHAVLPVLILIQQLLSCDFYSCWQYWLKKHITSSSSCRH